MPRIRRSIPGVDAKLLIKDAAKLLPDPSRRLFLRGAAGLGAITMLTGCDLIDSDAAESSLMKISRFNDRVQALLFNPNRLAPTYPDSMITKPFPFNALLLPVFQARLVIGVVGVGVVVILVVVVPAAVLEPLLRLIRGGDSRRTQHSHGKCQGQSPHGVTQIQFHGKPPILMLI